MMQKYEFNIPELSSMATQVLPGINNFLLRAEQYKNKRLAIVINNAAKTIDVMLSRIGLLIR